MDSCLLVCAIDCDVYAGVLVDVAESKAGFDDELLGLEAWEQGEREVRVWEERRCDKEPHQ